jgi:hypothetical protein
MPPDIALAEWQHIACCVGGQVVEDSLLLVLRQQPRHLLLVRRNLGRNGFSKKFWLRRGSNSVPFAFCPRAFLFSANLRRGKFWQPEFLSHKHTSSVLNFRLAGSRSGRSRATCQNFSVTCSRPDARKTARSSPGGGASTGPSAIDRRSHTIRGSARSHHIVRSLCDAPRRHHCRPVARFMRLGRPSAAILGRLPSPGVAGQGIWLM